DRMRHIWPGILIGGLTTVAGFAGLAWTSFPGLREIAVFTSVGVVVSILITRFILPGLLPTNLQASFLQRFLANKLSRIFRFLQHQRRYALIPLFIALMTSI